MTLKVNSISVDLVKIDLRGHRFVVKKIKYDTNVWQI